jgi:hypothetical protein
VKQNDCKNGKLSTVIGIIIVSLILFLASSCDNDKSKISSALYNKVASDIVENGGDPQFDIDYIEIDGNEAEIGYRLLGGSYKANAFKTQNGNWIIR